MPHGLEHGDRLAELDPLERVDPSELEHSPGRAEELVCQGCGNAYPVRDDIPVLLVDEARKPA